MVSSGAGSSLPSSAKKLEKSQLEPADACVFTADAGDEAAGLGLISSFLGAACPVRGGVSERSAVFISSGAGLVEAVSPAVPLVPLTGESAMLCSFLRWKRCEQIVQRAMTPASGILDSSTLNVLPHFSQLTTMLFSASLLESLYNAIRPAAWASRSVGIICCFQERSNITHYRQPKSDKLMSNGHYLFISELGKSVNYGELCSLRGVFSPLQGTYGGELVLLTGKRPHYEG